MTTTEVRRTGGDVRREVGHPVIDADGHMLEPIAAVEPYLRRHAPGDALDAWITARTAGVGNAGAPTPAQRWARRVPQSSWWGYHTVNVLDRATASLPPLMYERLDEMGIDLSILYPTNMLGICAVSDDALRQGLCRGFNEFLADVYGPFADRLLPAGVIPMHTPEEAVAELHHCRELGLRVVGFPEGVLRPIPEPGAPNPALFPGQTHWFDSFGLDSEHDYDPVWSTAAELGYAVTFHGALSLRPGVNTHPSSYVANHVGMFAALMYPLAKALLFGGVVRRHPRLPMVFLECGITWGVQMLLDTIEHWEKRNVHALEAFDPDKLDHARLQELVDRHGGRIAELLGDTTVQHLARITATSSPPEERDEFRHMGVTSPADIVEQFTSSLYFGCEADDRGIAAAFSAIVPGGRPMRPVFSSDIGHWDVTDVATVVSEAFELVEDGLLDAEQFRAFTFTNAYEMLTAVNPSFFDGTVLEGVRAAAG